MLPPLVLMCPNIRIAAPAVVNRWSVTAICQLPDPTLPGGSVKLSTFTGIEVSVCFIEQVLKAGARVLTIFGRSPSELPADTAGRSKVRMI